MLHQPIKDRVSHRGVAEPGVPVFDRQLARDDGGALGGAVVDDLQQVGARDGGTAKRGGNRLSEPGWSAYRSGTPARELGRAGGFIDLRSMLKRLLEVIREERERSRTDRFFER